MTAQNPAPTTASAPELDLERDGSDIREMFSEVAPRYDLLNHLLSGAMDFYWRRKAAALLDPLDFDKGHVLDLCSGTGDQALAIRKRHGVAVAAGDFCVPMLALAMRKFSRSGAPRPSGLASDALAVPFADESFDAATVSFGLRNVADLDRSLREMHRILRPGGRAVVLECSIPKLPVIRSVYLFYFQKLLPAIGRLISDRPSAYEYLPASVTDFPRRETFVEMMQAAGFAEAGWRDMTLGAVTLYWGAKTR